MFNREGHMTVGAWIGVLLLLSIPLVNIIMFIVLLASPDTNRSLKSYLVATLIFALIGIVLLIIIISAGLFTFSQLLETVIMLS